MRFLIAVRLIYRTNKVSVAEEEGEEPPVDNGEDEDI